MSSVTCQTLYGKKKLVSKDKLIFRISAYAIIIHKNKILLIKVKNTNKYFFPGGGVNLGEPISNALKREVKEETGIRVRIEFFFHYKESFFYYDPLDEAYHNISLFFICKPLLSRLIKKNNDTSEDPEWFMIKDLNIKKIQYFGIDVIKLIKKMTIGKI